MAKRMTGRLALGALWGLLPLSVALAPAADAARASSVFSAEASAVGGYSDGDGWTLNGVGAQTNSIGFEYLARLSGDRGDILTFDLQTRLSYDPMRPDDEPWAIEVHNAWVEHKLGLGSNVRAGHFEPAFGLERALDTHGTLLQTLIGEDVGFKHDWGLGYRGILGALDFEAAAQLGSGMGIERRDGSFLATARVSSPPGAAFQYGVSALHGRVLASMGMRTIPQPVFEPDAVTKTRVGADARWDAGSFLLAGEVTAGRDDDASVLGTLLQVGWPIPGLDALTLETQGQYWSRAAGADESSLGVSASYRLSEGWTLRAAAFQGLSGAAADEPTQVVFQAYYYGGLP
jgi:hypothetical protein